MYKDKFVLSIIHDGSPVKETGYRGNKEVAIPFDSEYKIRLKNKNDRSCTARVFIDGKKVSQLGDFIVTAGGSIDLERFVDSSLLSGKKFKFVSLDHEDVDDPTSLDNGIIKVEFRLAKASDGIPISPSYPLPNPPNPEWPESKPYFWEDNNGVKWVSDWNTTTSDGTNHSRNTTDTVYYCDSSGGQSRGSDGLFKQFKGASYSNSVRSVMDVNIESGATVEGGKSRQSFTYSDLDVDDSHVVTLKLKIVGINRERSMNKYKYCTNCGNQVRRQDKYCSECGHHRRRSA